MKVAAFVIMPCRPFQTHVSKACKSLLPFSLLSTTVNIVTLLYRDEQTNKATNKQTNKQTNNPIWVRKSYPCRIDLASKHTSLISHQNTHQPYPFFVSIQWVVSHPPPTSHPKERITSTFSPSMKHPYYHAGPPSFGISDSQWNKYKIKSMFQPNKYEDFEWFKTPEPALVGLSSPGSMSRYDPSTSQLPSISCLWFCGFKTRLLLLLYHRVCD